MVTEGNYFRPRYGRWTLQDAQVQLSLDDWMSDRHDTFLAQREPTSAERLCYNDWEALHQRQLHVADFDTIGLTLAWRY